MEMSGINRSSCNLTAAMTGADSTAAAPINNNTNNNRFVATYRQTHWLFLPLMLLLMLQILPFYPTHAHPVKRSIEETTINSNAIENSTNVLTVLDVASLPDTPIVITAAVADVQTQLTEKTIHENDHENTDNEILNERKNDYSDKNNYAFDEMENLEETIRNSVRNDIENEQEKQSAIIEALKEQETVPELVESKQEVIAENTINVPASEQKELTVNETTANAVAHDFVDHSDVFLNPQDNSSYMKRIITAETSDGIREAKQLEIGPIHNLQPLSDANSMQLVEEASYKVKQHLVVATTTVKSEVVETDKIVKDVALENADKNMEKTELLVSTNILTKEPIDDVVLQEEKAVDTNAFKNSLVNEQENVSRNETIPQSLLDATAEDTLPAAKVDDDVVVLTESVDNKTNDLSIVLEETLAPTELPNRQIIEELEKIENVNEEPNIIETTASPLETHHLVIKKQGVQLEETATVNTDVQAIEVENENAEEKEEEETVATEKTETVDSKKKEINENNAEDRIQTDDEENNAVNDVVTEQEVLAEATHTEKTQISEINIKNTEDEMVQEEDIADEKVNAIVSNEIEDEHKNTKESKETELASNENNTIEEKEIAKHDENTDNTQNDSSEESQEIITAEKSKDNAIALAEQTALLETITTEAAVTFKGSRSVNPNNFHHKYDDTAATLFEAYPPQNAEQTVNDNLAAETAKALPNSNNFTGNLANASNLLITICSSLTVLFILISLIIFMISFQRQHGTLDIEMQEQRCGKDNLDDDEDAETQTKLLEVELPPPSLLALQSEETDECL